MAIKNQKSASEKLIYVGPNLSRGRLLQYQVFIISRQKTPTS